MRAGEVYVNPASGERAVVILGTEETAGSRLVVDVHLQPGGGMAGRHHHPALHERFKVLEGEVTFTLKADQRVAEPGQTVNIPSGTLHSFWNSGSGVAVVRIDVEPAGRFAALIKNGFSLAQDGKTDPTGKPGLLQIALMAREFDDVIRYDMGPRIVQQLLFLALTPFAKLKGLKGSYPEYLTRPPSELIPLDRLDRAGL